MASEMRLEQQKPNAPHRGTRNKLRRVSAVKLIVTERLWALMMLGWRRRHHRRQKFCLVFSLRSVVDTH